MGARGLGEGRDGWEWAAVVSATRNFLRGEGGVCDFVSYLQAWGCVACSV